MPNVTECYKALEGAVPVVQTSPFSELLLVIALQYAYQTWEGSRSDIAVRYLFDGEFYQD